MITPAFGLTATERVLPKLALNFTTASLDPRVTFTRSGNTATVVNSSGLVATINADLPRFDYNPVTLVCKGLLIEEARTNICLNSQDFNTGWLFTNVTVGNDVVVSPDGTQNADSLTDNATTGLHSARRVFAIAASTQYTMSCYVKADTHNYVQLLAIDGNTTDRYATAIFDVSSSSVETSATQTAASTGVSIQSSSQVAAGNGWFRIIFTFTSGSNWSAATTSCRVAFAAAASGNTIGTTGGISYSGTGTTFYPWGAQLEAGAFATSYIPTAASQVTRTADVATMTGANFSDWFNASEGTFVAEGSYSANSANCIYVNDGTTSNRILVYFGASAQGLVTTSGAAQASLDGGTPVVGGALNTVCLSYKADSFRLALQGGSTVTDTSGTIPTVSQLNIGAGPGGQQPLNGVITGFNYYPLQLTSNEVQAFSK